MGTVGSRIAEALAARGLSQAELGRTVGASGGAVSGWVSCRKVPTAQNVEAIATALAVSPAWLQFGEGKSGLHDEKAERSAYRDVLRWYFRGAPNDRGREFGNVAGFAFEADIPTLARETGQNSLDELVDGMPTVDMDYTVIELKDAALKRFLNALRFDEFRRHLERAAASGQKAGAVIEDGLERLDGGEGLILVRIADYSAHGLTGPEYERGRFMAVCRNTLDSEKGDTAGGSYGLGKATMWASSWMGLVLTNSTLSEPAEGITANRLFARAELPWHDVDGEPYAGPGWFGAWDDDNECTRSYGGNATAANDLYVNRDDPAPGTTFLIVGAYDPSGAAEGLDAIADRLRRAVAENFWPAMARRGTDGEPKLRVTVRTQRGATVLSERLVDPADFVAPMVETLRRHYDDEVVDALETDEDVVRRSVTLRVPERKGDDGHPAVDHEVVVLVASQDADAPDGAESAMNRVVYLRGNNMVIRNYVLTNLPFGARPFHAIVLAGEAKGHEPEDRHAERFLRAAEPPAHNKWVSTPDVTARYARGAKSALDRLEDDIKTAIRDTIRQTTSSDSDGPDSLKELLRLLRPTETTKRPRVRTATAKPDAEGAWHVQAKVSVPPRTGAWRFAPVLKFGTESGAPIPVKWASLEAIAGGELDGTRFRTTAGSRSCEFRGVTDPASHPVGAARARVGVDIQDVREEV